MAVGGPGGCVEGGETVDGMGERAARVGKRWGLWWREVWLSGLVEGGEVEEEFVGQRRAARQRGRARQQQWRGGRASGGRWV